MRVVLDTVILVRGLINPFSRCGRIVFELAGGFQWVVSVEIVEEYLDALSRPELVRRYRTVATRDLDVILKQIATAQIVQPTENPEICRDPDDEKFLAAAVAAGAAFLVTEDHDLLVLESYEATQICTAGAFLQLLERRNDDQP